MKSRSPYREITTLRTAIVAIVVFFVGVLLLYLAGVDVAFWGNHEGLHALCENAGALLMISVGLGVLWELVGKRSFALEILDATKVGHDIEVAGIRRIGTNYLEEPEWQELFRNVVHLDIFVAYGQTWRNAHLDKLRALASRPNGRIRIFLPDPEDDFTIKTLAYRFSMTDEELVQRIRTTRDEFVMLRIDGGAVVEVFYWKGDRLYTFYLFDNTAVVTLYKHRTGRLSSIPTLVCRSPGTWYDFLSQELVDIREKSRPAA